eukprot:Clim_evm5s22 gene=Clim_evmTU5s22
MPVLKVEETAVESRRKSASFLRPGSFLRPRSQTEGEKRRASVNLPRPNSDSGREPHSFPPHEYGFEPRRGSTSFSLSEFRYRKLSSSQDDIRRSVVSLKESDLDRLTRINDYVIDKELGRGTSGVVFLAHKDNDEDIAYALKFVSGKKAARRLRGRMLCKPGSGPSLDDEMEDVRREIAILKKLHHPHIVRLYEVLEEEDNEGLYLVMEYVDGGVLFKLPESTEDRVNETHLSVTPSPTDNRRKHKARPIFQARMPETTARKYIVQLLLAVETMHHYGIAHRDIKPDNILVSSDGGVKLADFGIAVAMDKTMTRGTGTEGTPAFLSPEVIDYDEDEYDSPPRGQPADIWAMGVTFYMMVVGRAPFMSKSIPLLYDKIIEEEVTWPEDIDVTPECKRLIERMLEKDPEKRITAQEIRSDPWITAFGAYPLPSYDENVGHVSVSKSDMQEAIRERLATSLGAVNIVAGIVRRKSFNRRAGSPSLSNTSVSETAKESESSSDSKE